MLQKGKVSQVIGPVVDVQFASDKELPRIYDSLEIVRPDSTKLILEVQSHIGEDAPDVLQHVARLHDYDQKQHQLHAVAALKIQQKKRRDVRDTKHADHQRPLDLRRALQKICRIAANSRQNRQK